MRAIMNSIVLTDRVDVHYDYGSMALVIMMILVVPFAPKLFVFVPFGVLMARAITSKLENCLVDVSCIVAFNTIFKSPSGIGMLEYYLFFVELLFTYKYAKRMPKGVLLFLMIVVYMLFCAGNEYGKLMCISAGLMYLIVFSNCIRKEVARVICLSYPISLVISSVYAFCLGEHPSVKAYLVDSSLIAYGSLVHRFNGLLRDPNYFACYCLIAIYMLISFYINNKKKRVVAIVLLALTVYFGLITYSRMYYITLLFFLIIGLFVLLISREYKRLSIVLGITILFGLFLLAFGDSIIDNILIRFSGDDISSGRLNLWSSYLNSIVETPIYFLFGHGFSSSLVNGQGSHNLFLEILYYLGMSGFLLMIVYVIVEIRTSWITIGRSSRVYVLQSRVSLLFFVLMYLSLQGLFSAAIFVQIVMLQCAAILFCDRRISNHNRTSIAELKRE